MSPPFRVKDKVTGLYYCPSRSIQVKDKKTGWGFYVKSNLSKKGKIYWTDPRKHIRKFYDHTQVVVNPNPTCYENRISNLKLRDYVESEWELEAVKSS